MKSALWTALAVALIPVTVIPAAVIAQQAGSPTPPAAAADTSSEQGGGGDGSEFRVGLIQMNGQRNFVLPGQTPTAPVSGSIQGIDGLLRGSGAGISVRYIDGKFGNQPEVVSADVDLLLGPPEFTVILGASRRATISSFGTTRNTFGRAGAQLTFGIGGTGLRTQAGAWLYVPIADSTMVFPPTRSGEGEASVIYTTPRLPFYFQLGYRVELFTSGPTKVVAKQVPEEIRGLRLGAGIQFGGR